MSSLVNYKYLEVCFTKTFFYTSTSGVPGNFVQKKQTTTKKGKKKGYRKKTGGGVNVLKKLNFELRIGSIMIKCFLEKLSSNKPFQKHFGL